MFGVPDFGLYGTGIPATLPVPDYTYHAPPVVNFDSYAAPRVAPQIVFEPAPYQDYSMPAPVDLSGFVPYTPPAPTDYVNYTSPGSGAIDVPLGGGYGGSWFTFDSASGQPNIPFNPYPEPFVPAAPPPGLTDAEALAMVRAIDLANGHPVIALAFIFGTLTQVMPDPTNSGGWVRSPWDINIEPYHEQP